MIRGVLHRLLRRKRNHQVMPAGIGGAPREELAGGVDLKSDQQTFHQEAYPPVARPSPPDTGSRDLEDVPSEEIWGAIHAGAKDLIILSDEWKRRHRDDRHRKVLDLLGLPPAQAATSGPVPPPATPEDYANPIGGRASASQA